MIILMNKMHKVFRTVRSENGRKMQTDSVLREGEEFIGRAR